MKHRRFFLTPASFRGAEVTFPAPQAHQLLRVLRLRPGDHVTALDGSGREYEVEITELRPEVAHGRIVAERHGGGEPRARLFLYQALLKGDAFESVLRRCTELGVSCFVPVLCDRSVAVAPSQLRLDRWREIVREAAEQSLRSCLPAVSEPLPFADACRLAEGVRLLLWEGAGGRGVREALAATLAAHERPVSLFVGPEGGLAPNELSAARSAGLELVSLGPRILRAENAGTAAVTLILHEIGELS